METWIWAPLALALTCGGIAQAEEAEEYAPSAIEHRRGASRTEALRFLRELLADPAHEAVRDNLLGRYGELAREQGGEEFRAAMDRFLREEEAWTVAGGEGANVGPRPVLDRSRADAWYRRSEAAWAQLLRDWPDSELAPDAALGRAVALDALGQADEARQAREQFVQRWAEHPQAPAQLVALGEYWADRDNPYRALPFYRRATKADSVAWPLAMERLAWAQRAVGALDSAEQTLVALLRRGHDVAGPLVGVLVDLGDVGRGDTVLRAELEEPRAALVAFGQGLLDRGEVDGAAAVWRRQLTQAPLAADNPTLHGRLVEALWEAGRFDAATAETDAMAAAYASDGAWAARNDGRQTDADAVVAKGLADAATRLHRAGLRDRDEGQLRGAADRYGAWLARFGDREQATELRFWQAEALYGIGCWLQAADAYEAVVAAEPESELLRKAAAGAVYALDKLVAERRVDPSCL